MRLHRVPIVATGVLALAAVTSCGQSEPTTSPSQQASQSSPAPTSTSTSDTDAASNAATDTVREYFAILDELRQDQERSLDALAEVAASTQLTAQQRLLENERSNKLRQIGSTALPDVSVESVNLDNSDPKAGKVPTVTVDVCWDVSDADLVDASGKSVVSPDRVDVGWTRYTVANYEFQTDPLTGWRVASGKDLKQPPCEQ
ncbi:hypothetical protein ACFX43_04435 [Nocardioides sp. YIM B13467]|uniref:hypothetical protein n=1 Tax=Nocardioides sp. YIM B13467 TaxID=3366294 RepID=UPI00366BF3CA